MDRNWTSSHLEKKADRKEFPNILVSFERGWFQTCNLRNVWDVYSCPATPAEQFVPFLIHSEAFPSTSGLPSGQPCKQERTFLVTECLKGKLGRSRRGNKGGSAWPTPTHLLKTAWNNWDRPSVPYVGCCVVSTWCSTWAVSCIFFLYTSSNVTVAVSSYKSLKICIFH